MDFNFFNKKSDQTKGKKGKEGSNFGGSVAGTIFIFMLITAVYLMVSGGSGKIIPEIPISDLAKSVGVGEVKKILVEGEKLTITYQNDEIKKSKKELG